MMFTAEKWDIIKIFHRHQLSNAFVKVITKASRINVVTKVIQYMNNGMKVLDVCRVVWLPLS